MPKDAPAKSPKAPRPLSPQQLELRKLHETWIQQRAERLAELGLPPSDDEPPNWGRLAGAVAAWRREGHHDPWLMLDEYLQDPYWAGATRRVGGQDTGEAQPYPLAAILVESQWRKVGDRLKSVYEDYAGADSGGAA